MLGRRSRFVRFGNARPQKIPSEVHLLPSFDSVWRILENSGWSCLKDLAENF